MWPFKRKTAEETRSSGSGFTAEIMAAREAYVSGRRGIAELTATAQGAVTLWEGGLGLADVSGTDLLDRRSLALCARSLALRGEALFLIRDAGPCPVFRLGFAHPRRTAHGLPRVGIRGGRRAV